MSQRKLTQEALIKSLPLLNARELERQAGLRVRRIADVKIGKSSLTDEELEKIRSLLKSLA